MANILCFDTASKSCTVSLSIDGFPASTVESVDEGYVHSEKLNLYIKECMDKSPIDLAELHAIAVGRGPGSYTGLRIGVSSAKGMAYGLNIPLISIDTLQAMAAQVNDHVAETDLLCPLLDARRMEVYTALYKKDLSQVKPVSAEIISDGAMETMLDQCVVHFFGSGMEKCRTIFSQHQNARFIEHIEPKSASMCTLAETRYQDSRFEDVAYFEPFYLKEFMATSPKKMI